MRSKDHDTIEPKQPRRLLFRIGIWIISLQSAALLLLVVLGLNSTLRPGALFLIFSGAYVASYFVWDWIFFERAAELRKKIPISGNELRKTTKEFYDNLPR
jgi:hypothetical protein